MKQFFGGVGGAIIPVNAEITFDKAQQRYAAGEPLVWSHRWTESYPSGTDVEYVHTGSNVEEIEEWCTAWKHKGFPADLTAYRGEWRFGIPDAAYVEEVSVRASRFHEAAANSPIADALERANARARIRFSDPLKGVRRNPFDDAE